MSLQFSTAYRNTILDQLTAPQLIRIWTGAEPANCAAADSGTKLVEYGPATWSAASGGSKSLAGLPIAGTAIAGGTPGYYRLYDGGGACYHQGAIPADMTVDNMSINSGQQVNITGFTLIAPGA